MKVSFLILTVVFFSVMAYAFNNQEQPKKYKVEYTQTEWQSKLQWMQICQEIMRKSSLPGNVISQYQDSLSVFIQDTYKQLQTQIAADTTKPKN